VHTIANGDEWVLAGWHAAGNAPPDRKREAGFKHAVNEALRLRPNVVIFGQDDEAPMQIAAQACHAAGFKTYRCFGRGPDGVYTYCADLLDSMKVRVIGQTALLGQLRLIGCEAEGEQLEVSALRTMHGVGPKIAQAILDEGDPSELMMRDGWLPKCRAAEKVRAALTVEAYQKALEDLKLHRVEIFELEDERGPEALRALGLGMLADRIEESEREPLG
jgi:hypothetical protein